jgi:hypothetical protein
MFLVMSTTYISLSVYSSFFLCLSKLFFLSLMYVLIHIHHIWHRWLCPLVAPALQVFMFLFLFTKICSHFSFIFFLYIFVSLASTYISLSVYSSFLFVFVQTLFLFFDICFHSYPSRLTPMTMSPRGACSPSVYVSFFIHQNLLTFLLYLLFIHLRILIQYIYLSKCL